MHVRKQLIHVEGKTHVKPAFRSEDVAVLQPAVPVHEALDVGRELPEAAIRHQAPRQAASSRMAFLDRFKIWNAYVKDLPHKEAVRFFSGCRIPENW